MIDKARKVFKTFPLAESSLESIETTLFANTFKNFVDPEFPPNEESLFKYCISKTNNSSCLDPN